MVKLHLGRSFLVTVSFLTYGWSLLLAENWRGLSYLRLKFGLVFFLLTVENPFGLLTVPLSRNSIWYSFAYGSPTVSKKRRAVSKKTSIVSIRRGKTWAIASRIFLNSAILLNSGCFSLENIENLVLNLRPGSVY